MKKIIICLLVTSLLNNAKAQFEKGRWLMGIDINAFSYVTGSKIPNEIPYDNRKVSFGINSGFFMKNNWQLKWGVLFERERYYQFSPTSTNNYVRDVSKLGGLLGISKYKKILPNVYYTLNANIIYTHANLKNRINLATPIESLSQSNYNYYSANFSPIGFTYCLADKFLFSIQVLNINYLNLVHDGGYSDNNFNVSSNLLANGITINYLFKKSKK